MNARLPGAVLALALCVAAAASAIRVGGEFPIPPDEPLDLLVPGVREPGTALARSVERAQQLVADGELLLASGVLERAVEDAPAAVDLRLSLAQLYTRLGRYDDAVRIAEAAATADPNAGTPHAVLGDVYLRRGDVDRAVAAFQKYAGRLPKDAPAHERLADALHRRDSQAALQEYERALALEPKRVSALAKSAVVLVELGRAKVGALRAARAVALREDDTLALLALGYALRSAGKIGAAEQVYRRGIERTPDHPPFTLRLADVLVEGGDLEGAIRALEALLARVPEALSAREQLAKLYGQKGDSARRELELGRLALAQPSNGAAERHFAAALAADPKRDDAALELAALQLARGELDAAAARLAKLSEAGRSSSRAEVLRGHIALARKDVKAAETAYRHAVSADPADAAAPLALARLLARTERCGDAVKLYADAIERGARLAPVHSERAACHAEQGQLALAETSYRAALVADPQHVEALTGLARVYLRSEKNPELAGFLAERALAVRPDDAPLHYALARARLAAGRPAEAAEQLEAALAKKPDRPELLHLLGEARLELGQPDEARRRLERVLEVAPAYPQAAAVRALLAQIAAAPAR